MRPLLSLIVVAIGVIPRPPSAAQRTAAFSTPTLLTTIDAGKLKGEPTQLAWSADGAQLFLQMTERNASGAVKGTRGYVLALAGPKPASVATPPSWASDYWQWKAGKTPPDATSPEIEIAEHERSGTATEAPMGGSLSGAAQGGGTSLDDVTMRAQQMVQQHVVTLTLNGETVGEFVNQPFLPGYTFGWSPKAMNMIAYVNAAGRLAVMDLRGGKQELAASKAVILPAWSIDGATIAYLQKAGRKKYDLYTVRMTPGA
jgi:hypothetical protein